MDIYLLDQLMKGRLHKNMRILDAGCGEGRNISYFLKAGFDVSGVDTNQHAIENIKRLSPHPENFRSEKIARMSFDSETFDAVICCAVLHFCESEDEFQAMLREMWRVLAPGGFFFARLMSTIGIEHLVTNAGGRLFQLPGGSIRFLVDEEFLLAAGRELGGVLAEPIKTVNVQNQRCMTTWCLKKSGPATL